MKLLLDENVSDRIVQRIADLFPDSAHIKAVGLKEADDSVVWEWAKQHGFTIASKDQTSVKGGFGSRNNRNLNARFLAQI